MRSADVALGFDARGAKVDDVQIDRFDIPFHD
jgi:hypothetical protein